MWLFFAVVLAVVAVLAIVVVRWARRSGVFAPQSGKAVDSWKHDLPPSAGGGGGI